MDRSFLRLPDPLADAPTGERRRNVRQKLYTPVYASFNESQTGMVVDLSELLDLHEDGFAVQTSQRLEVNLALTLTLDLPETRSYIHGNGQVMWSDETGRGGIRFSALPESSRQIIKEWLFANLLIACSHHAARTEQLAQRAADRDSDPEKLPPLFVVPKIASVVPISEGSAATLSLVEAVGWEIRELGDDREAMLQIITARALSLTGASGAALALLADPKLTDHNLANDKMICRARAGESAPPLGTAVDTSQGLSGECVRTGVLVSCDDTENDSRVDPEIVRALGIRSLLAAPVVSNSRVVGLLEVFSPHPRGFARAHETVLKRLVEMIPTTHRERAEPQIARAERTSAETMTEKTTTEKTMANVPHGSVPQTFAEQVSPKFLGQLVSDVPIRASNSLPTLARTRPSRFFPLGLLALAVAVIAMALGYLSAPLIESWTASLHASQKTLASTVAGESSNRQSSNGHNLTLTDTKSTPPQPTEQSPSANSLADLRKLAEQGNADAQWQMGARYHNGEDVAQDDAQAVQWFERAAEQGNVASQGSLGAYYWRGRGVPEDLSKAYFWSEIAMVQGDDISKGRLEGIASQMTREEVSAARQQAEIWIHSHTQRPKSEAN
jgi:hypothetical protein